MSAQTIDFDSGERVLPRPARRPGRVAVAVLATMIALGVALPIFAGVVTWPVQSVRITGEFIQVSKDEIARKLAPLLAPGLLRIDLEAIRSAALGLAWVRDVRIRRVWPDGLEIAVIERIAVARWEDGGFIERDGTHFRPGDDVGPDALPVLGGPEGTQQRVLDLHAALERGLAPLGASLDATRLTRRGVLHASLRDGPHLVMRPDAVEHTIETHAKALAAVFAGRLDEIERVDFRYASGFAVRPRSKDEESERQR